MTVAQHLPLGKGLIGIGANGFYLQQTTGDSGSGARLGSFEEMTAGVGPVLSYAAQFGKDRFRGRSEVAAPNQRAEHTQRRLRLVQNRRAILINIHQPITPSTDNKTEVTRRFSMAHGRRRNR